MSQLPSNSKPSVNPNVTNLLSNIAATVYLMQILHDGVLHHDDSMKSLAKSREEAFFVEHNKLCKASEDINAMGREMEILRQEITKNRHFEEMSKRLAEDLAASEARYRELYELHTQAEVKIEELEDNSTDLEVELADLRAQVANLETKQGNAEIEPPFAQEQAGERVHTSEPTSTEDEKSLGFVTSNDTIATAGIGSPEYLQSSRKRKDSEVDEEPEEEPKKPRRRK